jgi:predicted metal-dependent hydrolase
VLRTGVLIVDDLAVEVTVRRVVRMNLRVHPPDGSVRLSVPARTSQRSARRFVRDSRAWIEQHRSRIAESIREQASRPTARSARGVTGESWDHLGRTLRLVVAAAPRTKVQLRGESELAVAVPEPDDPSQVLAAIDRWQRRELRAAAGPLLDAWGERIGVAHRFLGLRRMSTRWGSCVPARGRIWLNVALVARPPELLEYVVVHELVHLLEASHGPRFMELMDLHLPDWRQRRIVLDATV